MGDKKERRPNLWTKSQSSSQDSVSVKQTDSPSGAIRPVDPGLDAEPVFYDQDQTHVPAEPPSAALAVNATGTLVVEEPPVGPAHASLTHRLTIGERSTFASAPWWSSGPSRRQLTDPPAARHLQVEYGVVGRLAVMAATIRGDKNAYLGKVNEDAFALAVARCPDGREYLVAVVCDGVSNAEHSGRTSYLTSKHLATAVSRDVSGGVGPQDPGFEVALNRSLGKVREELDRMAASWPVAEGKQCNRLGTTVTIVIVDLNPTGASEHPVVVASIGDSPVLRLSAGQWSTFDEEESDGDLLDMRTHAFPSTAVPWLRHGMLQRPDSLFVLTDGVGNFIQRGGTTFKAGEVLAGLWAQPLDLIDFVRSVTFDLRTADDDRTVVGIWLLEAGAPA